MEYINYYNGENTSVKFEFRGMTREEAEKTIIKRPDNCRGVFHYRCMVISETCGNRPYLQRFQ